MPLINEASDEDLIEELANRGIDILDIKHCTDEEMIRELHVRGYRAGCIKGFTDNELNAEIDRRRKIIEKQHNDLMEGKI